MVWLGFAMMIAAAVVFLALVPRGGPRIKSEGLQGWANVIVMLVFIFGAIFVFGVH